MTQFNSDVIMVNCRLVHLMSFNERNNMGQTAINGGQ